jgi:hypothetical protein
LQCRRGTGRRRESGLVQHLGALDDPSAVAGTEEDVRVAFRKTREEIRRRLEESLEKSR